MCMPFTMSSFCDTYVDRGHSLLLSVEKSLLANRLMGRKPDTSNVTVSVLNARTANACRVLGKYSDQSGSVAEQWSKHCANLYRAIVAKEPQFDNTNHMQCAVDTLDATVLAISRNECLKLVGSRPTLMSF